ncbi:hypothetical protein [Nocardia aurantia]|uniref:Uncharacterized protein n=1 Tax=Nocardia aurantia TaxID=2585199 RepID=A0A7K0DYY3_9NOCA|nr:hypothetical protein [Nocardia aurantia]MQY30901.1 hypothetical protein [Nocardia aurantia]
MLSTFAGIFSTIGSDVLSLGQSIFTLIGDLANPGGYGYGGYGGYGGFPPGQYPLA